MNLPNNNVQEKKQNKQSNVIDFWEKLYSKRVENSYKLLFKNLKLLLGINSTILFSDDDDGIRRYIQIIVILFYSEWFLNRSSPRLPMLNNKILARPQ